jgi:hypothetical protein
VVDEHFDKLADDQLVELARRQADERAEVVIELNLPSSKVDISPRSPRAGGPPRPVDILPQADDAATGAKIAEARRMVMRETGMEPVWIGAAKAMVAELTGKQLGRVVASPLVRRIYPNRTLRRSSG